MNDLGLGYYLVVDNMYFLLFVFLMVTHIYMPFSNKFLYSVDLIARLTIRFLIVSIFLLETAYILSVLSFQLPMVK